jgi:hypothetical protein
LVRAAVIGNEPERRTAEDYRRFAARQACGRSPLYEDLAKAVADDAELLAFLDELPREKRQPNLLLATVRYLAGVQACYESFRAVVLERRAEVAATMLARRTQTNEPARCATLLPALASLRQPLALLEVGASAGLCLLPDRYSYDYGVVRIDGESGAPVVACRCLGQVPLPSRPVEVAWRAGIDLNPLDVTDPDDVRWLSCLLWPGEGDRAERLAAAVDLARRDPPRLIRGDLIDQLAETAAGAPPQATLVVFHSAVLPYVRPSRWAEFARTVAGLGAIWLSQEGPDVMAELPGFPRSLPDPDPGPAPFVLTRDESQVLAYTDAHGTWIRWLA